MIMGKECQKIKVVSFWKLISCIEIFYVHLCVHICLHVYTHIQLHTHVEIIQ